ncbi:hypothetical protein BVC93_15600 [Mycobacterium sp. MS1601]|nr:hypothetical protein BVC93_15600 [Mycobacterium sp. MS1601]
MYAPLATLMTLVAISPLPIGTVLAATAAADCTSSAGVTLCSQGDVRGSDTGDGPSGSGPYVPYPCEYDYLCDDDYGWGVAFDLDADLNPPPIRPDRPDRPNRPRGGGRR